MTTKTKNCSDCFRNKPLADFPPYYHTTKQGKQRGHRKQCRECIRPYNTEKVRQLRARRKADG